MYIVQTSSWSRDFGNSRVLLLRHDLIHHPFAKFFSKFSKPFTIIGKLFEIFPCKTSRKWQVTICWLSNSPKIFFNYSRSNRIWMGRSKLKKKTDRRENETCENGAKKSKPFSSWLHIYLRTENPTDELLDLDMADKFDLGGGTFGGYPSNSKSFFFRHLLI